MKPNLFRLSLPAAAVFGLGALFGGGTLSIEGRSVRAEPIDLKSVIAIVDMDRAEVAFPMAERVGAELRDYATEINGELKVLMSRQESLETEKTGYERGTEAYRGIALQIEMTKFELAQRQKFAEADFARRQDERLRDVRFELHKQVADFAKKKGFQLILRARGGTTRPMQAESYFVEDVLYADDQLDVTQALIDFLQAGAPDK